MNATEAMEKVRQFHVKNVAENGPVRRFFREIKVLAFDQSLTNTGWAKVDCYDQSVEATGMISPTAPNLKSFELTFEKARQLEDAVVNLLDLYKYDIDVVLVEMPAVVGYRTESSLIAAEKVFTACRLVGLPKPVIVSRQHAAAVVAGNGKADKKETSAAVDAMITARPDKCKWNEHIRDAVLLALCEGLDSEGEIQKNGR